jgi:hypothetical protein
LQAGGPALGAGQQCGQAGRRQFQPGRLPQQGSGLVLVEPQVALTQLDQLTVDPQPRQRQRRVDPSGQHHLQLRRQALEQMSKTLVDRRRVDHVVVVQHQRSPIWQPGHPIDDHGDHRFQRGGLWTGKQRCDQVTEPSHQQGCLAESGRRADERELPFRLVGQALEQPR